EPVKGLHGDNYYYQLVANIRRYKGVHETPVVSIPKSIDIAGTFEQWHDVDPTFASHAFDTDRRDFGSGERHYVNNTGRNDVVLSKVARDATSVCFYAKTR